VLQTAEAAQQPGKRNSRLHARHVHAGAGVVAVAEGDMAVGLAPDVEALGLRELPGIPVRRPDTERDERAGRQRASAQLDRGDEPAVIQLDRTLVAQHLFDRRRKELRRRAQATHLFRMGEEQPQAVSEEVGRGLVAGIQKKDAVVVKLVRAQIAARYEARKYIAIRVAGRLATLVHEPREVVLEAQHRAVAALEHLRRGPRLQAGQDRERPCAQRPALGARNVEQVADDLHRDAAGEIVDEIAARPELIEQRVDERGHAGLHARDGALIERTHDEPAHAGMQRRIVEHQARRVMLVERRVAELGLELDALVRARVGAAVQRHHVFVARDEEAAALHLVHRVLLAQRGVIAIRVVVEVLRHRGQPETADIHQLLLRAMPRTPLAQFEPKLKARLEELWGTPPNLYKALANHPALVAAWTEFSKTLRHDTRTPRALRELVILRGAQLMRSEYEWAQHLAMARKAGVREEQIENLAKWAQSPLFTAQEKAALALGEAVTQGGVTDAVYAEAKRHFDDHDYVELALVAAFYAMVGRMLDAMGVELEPDMRDYKPKLP
jgi:4-carboxymuconolactone decarboxylase